MNSHDEAVLEAALASDETGCAECGSTEGPDRQARWECGEKNLDTWETCSRCDAPLCDTCAAADLHDCLAGEPAQFYVAGMRTTQERFEAETGPAQP